MGSFARNARDDREQLDFQLMLNSSVQKFWSRRLLEDALGWLRGHGYRIIELPAAEWRSEADLHLALEQHLSFPSYYGRNLDALDECISSRQMCEGCKVVVFGYGTRKRHEWVDSFPAGQRAAQFDVAICDFKPTVGLRARPFHH
jgi:hypothetical protein